MHRADDPNIARLEAVAARLRNLLDELTLVGGCTAGLLMTDPGSPPPRPTVDVDLAVEAVTLAEYHAFEKRVSATGLKRGQLAEDPICRWRDGQMVVDLMPLDEQILGFGNRWYRSAISHRTQARLPSGSLIHHVDAPHFLATKLDAFITRGQRDKLGSTDLEDIVRVVDGRAEIVEETSKASDALRAFVSAELRSCLRDRFFLEALPGHFEDRDEAQARMPDLVTRLRRLADS